MITIEHGGKAPQPLPGPTSLSASAARERRSAVTVITNPDSHGEAERGEDAWRHPTTEVTPGAGEEHNGSPGRWPEAPPREPGHVLDGRRVPGGSGARSQAGCRR